MVLEVRKVFCKMVVSGGPEAEVQKPKAKGLQRYVVYLGWPIAPSYMSPNAGWGGQLQGLSHWVPQLYTGDQINFGDPAPYLTYAKNPSHPRTQGYLKCEAFKKIPYSISKLDMFVGVNRLSQWGREHGLMLDAYLRLRGGASTEALRMVGGRMWEGEAVKR